MAEGIGMTAANALEIKVVYSASGRPRAKVVRTALGTRRGIGLMALGILNLAASAVFYYATWWPADRFFYMTVMMYTPIPGVDAGQASQFLLPPNERSKPARLQSGPAADSIASNQEIAPAGRWHGRTAATVIGGTMYGWLTLATIAYGLLAFSAGVAWSKWGAGQWQRIWAILALGVLLGLGVFTYEVWSRPMSGQLTPNQLRIGMIGVCLLGLLGGLAWGRAAKAFCRAAGIAVILSALGSVVALRLLNLSGALEPVYASIPFLAMVFAIHSFFGWLLLLPIASRLRAA
jgi:hypothetical protein